MPSANACRISALATPFRHSLHAYHGISPWDQRGDALLYLGIDDLGQPASIVVRDLKTNCDRVVASTGEYDFHTAAGQRWVLDDSAVVFKSRDKDGVLCPALVSLEEPGRARLLEGLRERSIRHICRGGERVVASFKPRSQAKDEAAVELVNLKTQQAGVLLTASEAAAKLPEKPDDATGFYFNHPVFSDDETRLFCKLMRDPKPGGNPFVAFFVLDLPTRELRCLGDRVNGHPHWMPDNRHILNIKSPRDGSDNRWLVLVDAMTGEDERLLDLPIEGPGHPSPSPDGRWIVTDAFTADGCHSPIYLVDPKLKSAREIARLPHQFRGGASYQAERLTRGQPHPVWSPCGRKLLVNCNSGGERMQLLLLEDFLPAEGSGDV